MHSPAFRWGTKPVTLLSRKNNCDGTNSQHGHLFHNCGRCTMSQRIFLTLRSMIYITGFMLFWLWLMPRWLNLNTSATLAAVAPVRWLGLIPLLVGAGLAISCFINFAAIGKGTPAPFD